MSTKSGKTAQKTRGTETDVGERRWVRMAAYFVLVGCAVLVLVRALWPSRTSEFESSIETRAGRPPSVPLMERRAISRAQPERTVATSGSPVQAATSDALPMERLAPLAEPSPETRHLVASLVTLQSAGGSMTQEQADAWKQHLQELIQHGDNAVPAIREFLGKNLDFDFGPGGRQMFGFSSARAGMIDALTQIGGPWAVGTLMGAMENTADPREIALLAQALDKLEPDHHRAEGKLPHRDVAPLFEVLKSYGDSSLVPELEQHARRWGYYSAATLAQLPEGAGIPSLLQIAQGETWNSGARDAAWQMIAQVASANPDARAALVEQARQNKLSTFNWASMSAVLGGDQIQFKNAAFDPLLSGSESSSMTSGDQRLFAAPTMESMRPERMNQQMALLDELLAVASDPTATLALQQSRALLLNRISQVMSGRSP